ncbi:MAG: protoheme IX farnesyltransferase [Candidatus Omnitrophica bacterium]|nr:protoheme IX farnesyltransferase [Candidatus Omnitrophota bacterium]
MLYVTRALVAATFLLLIAGGLVTSTGSGLAVPDWPLSYGQWMPPMVGGILFEHGHRMIAAGVGLATLLLTVWIGLRERRRGVRALAIAALGAVVAQGLLGGLTVLWRLPAPVSIAHAMLGPTFFILVVLLATQFASGVALAGTASTSPARATPSLTGWAGATLLALYGQLLLGAVLRHGGWGPKLLIAHVGGAIVTAIVVLTMAWRVLTEQADDPRLTRRAAWLSGLVLVQVLLGFATLASHRSVLIATAHAAVGALLLANASVLLWHTLRNRDGSGTVPISAYLELTKPRLTLLAVLTTWVGLHLAAPGPVPAALALATLAGAALVGGAGGALNQYLEWERDAKMARTRRRPLPSGRLAPRAARTFGLLLGGLGLAVLALSVNLLAAGLGLATLITYLAVYTPLKTRTPLCTLAGAVPGALPPLIGWAAARGALDAGGWTLFALMFLWQLPHFLALAWMYRDDYARAGFQMLPAMDPTGHAVGRQIALSCLALLPVSLVPTVLQVTGNLYFAVALILGLAFLGLGTAAAVAQTPQSARRLFLASITYLPGLFTAMALDKIPW